MNQHLEQWGLVPFFTQQILRDGIDPSALARVVAVQRSQILVACENGLRQVTLSSLLMRSEAIDRPTVGDWVLLDDTAQRIDAVLDRKSLFKRLAAGAEHQAQPIAANIDTLFVVTSCNEEFKESRLERYLTVCDEAGAMPVIVLTKIDLTDDVESFVARARTVQAGVPVETANTLDPETLSGVRAWIDERSTVALVGSSGVGKSSLLNTLAGDAVAATGEIRVDDKKGRHTTTHRELHKLPGGGLLIDVPGMRELKVLDIESSIGAVFDDIEQRARDCRFADCEHDGEPGCAVATAIDAGEIDARRLQSYRKLQRENTQASATQAEKRAKGRDFARLVKEAKRIKSDRSHS